MITNFFLLFFQRKLFFLTHLSIFFFSFHSTQFRVALILSAFREIELYSEQSLVIITAEGGPPASEPAIVRAVAVDHARISISWEQGRLKNGPILFYVLTIKESNQNGYFTYKVHNEFIQYNI